MVLFGIESDYSFLKNQFDILFPEPNIAWKLPIIIEFSLKALV